VFGLKAEEMDLKPRPIVYDEDYIMFGNREIRIRFK